jgi:hypothetical protein
MKGHEKAVEEKEDGRKETAKEKSEFILRRRVDNFKYTNIKKLHCLSPQVNYTD